LLEREGSDGFDAVIVSTLPPGVSRWLGLDAPTQIRRRFGIEVIHLIGHLVEE